MSGVVIAKCNSASIIQLLAMTKNRVMASLKLWWSVLNWLLSCWSRVARILSLSLYSFSNFWSGITVFFFTWWALSSARATNWIVKIQLYVVISVDAGYMLMDKVHFDIAATTPFINGDLKFNGTSLYQMCEAKQCTQACYFREPQHNPAVTLWCKYIEANSQYLNCSLHS